VKLQNLTTKRPFKEEYEECRAFSASRSLKAAGKTYLASAVFVTEGSAFVQILSL